MSGMKFTIDIVPVPEGLRITVPEIDAVIEIPETARMAAIDAAHRMIIAYLAEHDIRIDGEEPVSAQRQHV